MITRGLIGEGGHPLIEAPTLTEKLAIAIASPVRARPVHGQSATGIAN